MLRSKKITLGIAAGALALGAGMGVTTMASAATTPSPSQSATSSTDGTAPGQGHGRHGFKGDRGQLASKLATKLGVDESKVTEALKAFREANKPTTPPAEGTKPDRTAMEAALAKSLAEKLGIDEAKVTAALQEIRAEEQADRAAALKSRLDAAVAGGKLTQAEADAVTKAVQNGVIRGR